MANFQRDDRVSHAQHGPGVVVETTGVYTTIAFDEGGVRKFITRLVQLERSTLPLPVRPAGPPRRARPRAKANAAVGARHDA